MVFFMMNLRNSDLSESSKTSCKYKEKREGDWVCDVCGRVFTLLDLLYIHLLTHRLDQLCTTLIQLQVERRKNKHSLATDGGDNARQERASILCFRAKTSDTERSTSGSVTLERAFLKDHSSHPVENNCRNITSSDKIHLISSASNANYLCLTNSEKINPASSSTSDNHIQLASSDNMHIISPTSDNHAHLNNSDNKIRLASSSTSVHHIQLTSSEKKTTHITSHSSSYHTQTCDNLTHYPAYGPLARSDTALIDTGKHGDIAEESDLTSSGPSDCRHKPPHFTIPIGSGAYEQEAPSLGTDSSDTVLVDRTQFYVGTGSLLRSGVSSSDAELRSCAYFSDEDSQLSADRLVDHEDLSGSEVRSDLARRKSSANPEGSSVDQMMPAASEVEHITVDAHASSLSAQKVNTTMELQRNPCSEESRNRNSQESSTGSIASNEDDDINAELGQAEPLKEINGKDSLFIRDTNEKIWPQGNSERGGVIANVVCYRSTVINNTFSGKSAAEEDKKKSRDPHECPECKKILSSRGNLTKHLVLHSSIKPYKCDQCDSGFNTKRDYTLHNMQKHTGERPFVCQICGKGFANKQYLVEHARGHSDEKPYVCEICGKSFLSSNVLRRHHKRHANLKSHICEFCGKGFVIRYDLKSHIQRLHLKSPSKEPTPHRNV